MTKRLLLPGLFILLVCWPGVHTLSAEILYRNPTAYFKGRIGLVRVEVLLEHPGREAHGLLHYPGKDETFRLVPSPDGRTLEERTLFENQPTGQVWRLDQSRADRLRGFRQNGDRLVRFSIKRRGIEADPRTWEAAWPELEMVESLFFELCLQVTGICYELLYFGGTMERPPDRLTAKDIQVKTQQVNLFGDIDRELLIEVRINTYIHVVRFWDPQQGWVPNMLWFKRKNRDAVPCLTDPPGPAFFYFRTEEVVRPGEYVLTGYTYDGNCTFITRGDQIEYYIWRIGPKGVQELFQAPVRSYWYDSPNPAPIKRPVYQEFQFVSQQPVAFPRLLMKKQAVFPYPNGIEEGVTLRPIDFRIRYIDLFNGG